MIRTIAVIGGVTMGRGIAYLAAVSGYDTVLHDSDAAAQATPGMSYSLVSRDIMAAMVEIHALGHPHDGMVLISGNDKSVPAHLLAIARCDLPAIHLQPEYRKLGMHDGMLPVTERVSRSTLALPFFVQLEDEDVEYVCASLREVVEGV